MPRCTRPPTYYYLLLASTSWCSSAPILSHGKIAARLGQPLNRYLKPRMSEKNNGWLSNKAIQKELVAWFCWLSPVRKLTTTLSPSIELDYTTQPRPQSTRCSLTNEASPLIDSLWQGCSAGVCSYAHDRKKARYACRYLPKNVHFWLQGPIFRRTNYDLNRGDF